MQVGIINIKTLFHQDRRLVVPLYQRPYVWHRELQWEPLWDDLRAVAERRYEDRQTRPHFLGAIVLEQVPQSTAAMETRLVIDGQQRLTTIQVLMEAFHDYCDTVGAIKHHKAMVKLVRNDDPMTDDPQDVYKVWPTNVDREHFVAVMEERNPSRLKLRYGKSESVKVLGHPILDGYLFFYEAIESWATNPPEARDEKLDALVNAIREDVRLVVIDVDNEDDAQVIFETLNARGTPLLPSDLVKNHLFHRAELEKEKLDALYDKHWRPFEEGQDFWRGEIGRGHAKRARVDIFLQHYLTLQVRDEIAVGHLYAAFREHSNHSKAGNARQQLENLRRFAQIYEGFERFPEGSPQAVFFDRLAVMELFTLQPFLMELFARFGHKDAEVLEVLRVIESFLVRRMVCQLTTRSYNRLFIDLLPILDHPLKDLPARFREALMQNDTEHARWPSDEEFKTAWMSSPLYKTLMRSRLRMVLEALDEALRSEFGEKLVLKDKLTIEHLMPQSWQEAWPLPEGVVPERAERDRNQLIHTLGNLTLLSKKLNPSISNGGWEGKLADIQLHSRMNLNAGLAGYPLWNEDTIRERGERLFEVASKIWQR